MNRIPLLGRVTALLVAAALLVGACAGSPSASTSPSTAPSSSNQASGSAPQNDFTLAVGLDVLDLDPAAAGDTPGRIAMVNLYEPLLRYEGSPPQPVPHLAESITPSADGKTYTVKLRPNLKFHDGSDVDAEAVVYSMDRLLTIGKTPAQALSKVLQPGDTNALDELTVQFNLRQASAVFPGMLVFFFIVNPNVIEANTVNPGPYGDKGDYGEAYLQTADAGSGPYMLTSRTPNADLQFQHFPRYWQGWKPEQYGRLTYKVVPEPATAALLLSQGEVDMTYDSYPVEAFDSVLKDPNSSVRLDSAMSIKPFVIFLNTRKAPTDDIKVRQAISYAFDYVQAVESVYPGSERLPGPVPAGQWAALSEPAYGTDLDKAKALLAEAGIAPGTVTLDYASLFGPASIYTRTGLLLQDGLSKIGINLNITQNQWPDLVNQWKDPTTTQHATSLVLSADYADPDSYLPLSWSTASDGTYFKPSWYSNPRVDELLEKGRAELDVDARLAIYQEAQEIIVEDASTLFVWNTPVQVAMNKNIQGYDFVVYLYNYSVYNLSKAQ